MLGLLGGLPLAAKLRRLLESLTSDPAEVERDFALFRQAQRIRNEIAHGKRLDATYDDASDVRGVLERVLARILQINLPEPVPTFHEVVAQHVRRVAQ